MSRIGKKPIPVPDGVTIDVKPGLVAVKGPKGELSQAVSPEMKVTQENGTERPFTGEYWDHKEPGIYVGVVSGEPLFASTAKFHSDSGWPSFTKPIEPANVNELRNDSHGMTRTEVRCFAWPVNRRGYLFSIPTTRRPGPRGNSAISSQLLFRRRAINRQQLVRRTGRAWAVRYLKPSDVRLFRKCRYLTNTHYRPVGISLHS